MRLVKAAALLCTVPTVWAATVTLNPIKDTTIYDGSDATEDFTDNSCGAGTNLFIGMTNDNFPRRALVQFDIAGNIPAGSTINSVTLDVDINRSGDNQLAPATLHVVTKDWGEGIVNCDPVRGGGFGLDASEGDATWLDAEYLVTVWNAQGGDYDPASATALLTTRGTGTWDSTGNSAMVTDIQNWLDNSASNFGWIILGDETRVSTARRFASREGTLPPALTVDFTPTGDVFACCFDDGTCSITDTTSCVDQGGTPDTNTNSCEPNICPQPTGACCNLDESCSDNVPRLDCEDAGGAFQGGGTNCGQGNVDCGLTPFVDALPIPPVLQPDNPGGTPLHYTVSIEEATQQLHSELPSTELWTYNGAYPSFTLEAIKDEPIEVNYVNNLPSGSRRRGVHILAVDTCPHGPNYYGDSARVVAHLHGGHLPARFDGQPELHILPGESDLYEYPNNQDAATLWYHDHALGTTRLNVYAGMAGFYLLRDAQDTGVSGNAFGLPFGEDEIELAIQDKEFNSDGSLFYNPTIVDAFKGNKILVNGKVWPFLNVKQGKYRFRMLNGSQSRQYSLRMEVVNGQGAGPPFNLIGTDLGLIDAPIELMNFTMVPGERFDVIVDFAGFLSGTEIILRNDDDTVPLIPNVMKFVVTNQPGFTDQLPATLRTVTPLDPTGVPIRHFRLEKEDLPCQTDPNRTIGEWLVKSLDGPDGAVTGKKWDDLDTFPVLGSREIWEFENLSNSPHPMHVHLVKFQILDKFSFDTNMNIPLEPWEANTWKDVVNVPPRSKAKIIMDFEDYLGRFPLHCHILDHEDHEMMRQFQTVQPDGSCNNNSTCDKGEDCISCPNDCSTVSGAFCGNGLCEAGDGEDCIECPEDCAGKLKGQNQFCCGLANPPLRPCQDERCIDALTDTFCRDEPRVRACCGDKLCEGAETEGNCAIDCAGEVDCSRYGDRDSCNADPACSWSGSPRNGSCGPA